MMNNPYLDEIQKLDKMDDIKRIVKKWNTLSENIEKLHADVPILLPQMLWISKSGVGKTHLLKLISEYLYAQKNLMKFYGMVKFFEFSMGYCPPNAEFTELRRFIDAVSQAAGFRSEYKGIVCVNIDEWVGHEEEKHFFTLLEYLSDNCGNWLVIFLISPQKNAGMQNVERILTMFFRIDKVMIELPGSRELMEFVKRQLREYDLSLNGAAEKILTRTIEVLQENPYFDGYKTLRLLCQDIVYSIYTSKKSGRVVTEKTAARFSEESDYVKRTIRKIVKRNTIGFGRD